MSVIASSSRIAVTETPCTRMATPIPSSGRSISGTRLRGNVSRSSAARRVAVAVQAVASPIKSSSPAKKASDQISSEEAKTLYRDMVLGREFEEMCAQMYYRGKMFGFVHLYSGQEAVSTGKNHPSILLVFLSGAAILHFARPHWPQWLYISQ